MDKKTLFVFLLIIFSLKFFDVGVANTGVLKNVCFGFMFMAIIASWPYFFKYNGGFVLPIQLICVAILISIFMAQYTWGQGFKYSATTIPYAIWFVFFLLLRLNVSIKVIENIVLIYGALYIVLFLFQFTHPSVVYFGMRDIKEDRGVMRIIFPGGGVFFLSCFIAINRVTTNTKYRTLWLAFALVGIVIVVLQVSRQTIAILIFLYLLHFLENVKLQYKIATVFLFALCTYIFLNSKSNISTGLIEQQKEDASYGSNYIRILSEEYYLTQFTPNTVSKIFGNGFANDNSNYGKALTNLSMTYGYYLSDVGLVELYIELGVLGVIAYILIFIKSFTIPLPKNYHYLKYYLWMVMLTSLTSDILISYSYLIATVLVLYSYQRIMESQIILSNVINGSIDYEPGSNNLIIIKS